MIRTAEQYADQVHALANTGLLWRALKNDPLWSGLIDAFSQEFSRVDVRVSQLLDELDPYTILELINEAEKAVGLPDSCRGLGSSIEQRRLDLKARRLDKGGYGWPIWKALVESFGFTNVSFDEFKPADISMSVDSPMYGDEWVNAFRINAKAPPVIQFSTASSVDESLGDTSATSRLECVVRHKAASHTTPLFNYI